MGTKEILTWDNKPTEELQETVTEIVKGIEISYAEVYYMDFDVDEDTGIINKNKEVKYYTKTQMGRNMKALNDAYIAAKSQTNN